MAPKPAPIAAKAHRPSILRAAVRVSVRRAATICTAMSNLFTSRCGEDGGLPLRHDFSTRETYYSCSPLTEISETRQATRQSRREFGGDKGPVHNLVMPAATSASTPISSADAVASRIGTSGTLSCSAAARSSADPAGAVWPTSSASNLFGIVRHAASASSARVNPTGSYPHARRERRQEEVRFARDSPLEEARFEPSVPL
jgi:hypothetical protein